MQDCQISNLCIASVIDKENASLTRKLIPTRKEGQYHPVFSCLLSIYQHLNKHQIKMAVNIVDLTQSPTIPVAPRAETPDSVAIEFAVANDSKETLRRIVKASSRIQPLAVKFLENELLASMTSVKNGDSISTNEETEDDEDDEEEQGTDEDSEDNNEDKEVKAHTAVPRAYEQPLAQVAGQKRMYSRFVIYEQCNE